MKYLALLRGINVGGSSIIKMSDLKKVFENAHFTQVKTYINSGNVLFIAEEQNIENLTKTVDLILEKSFFPIKTIVISFEQLQSIIANQPKNWGKEDLRKYIAFLCPSIHPEEVIKEMQLKEGIDFAEKGPGVVYMSTRMEGLTKSNFPKLSAKKIYQAITIRNVNTVEKLLFLMTT